MQVVQFCRTPNWLLPPVRGSVLIFIIGDSLHMCRSGKVIRVLDAGSLTWFRFWSAFCDGLFISGYVSTFLPRKICCHYDLVRAIVLRDLRKWVHPEPTDEGSSSSYHCKNNFDTPWALCDDRWLRGTSRPAPLKSIAIDSSRHFVNKRFPETPKTRLWLISLKF